MPGLTSRQGLRRLAGVVRPRLAIESANRLDGLRPRFRHEHYRTTFITERPAQFAVEVFSVGLRKQFIAVDKQQKSRRHLLQLSRIKEFEPVFHRAVRLPS